MTVSTALFRVRAKEGPHGGCEGEADFGLHLNLPEPFLCDLDRILGRPDFAGVRVESMEDCMEGRSFS